MNRGCDKAKDDGIETVRGTGCRRYGTVASFALASERAKRPLGPHRTTGHVEPEQLTIAVWLDEAGRIRRAILHRGPTLMKLEFSDFGGPDPIELPGPDEFLPPDG